MLKLITLVHCAKFCTVGMAFVATALMHICCSLLIDYTELSVLSRKLQATKYNAETTLNHKKLWQVLKKIELPKNSKS